MKKTSNSDFRLINSVEKLGGRQLKIKIHGT